MNERGFTLVEILVVSAVFGIVLVMLGGMFVKGTTLYREGVEQSKHHRQIIDALNQLTEDVKQARGVVSGSSSRMVLRLSDPNAGANIDRHRTYNWSQGRGLEYRDRSGQQTILRNIQGLEFHYDRFPPETNHVIVKVTTEVADRPLTTTTSAYLRNTDNRFPYFTSP